MFFKVNNFVIKKEQNIDPFTGKAIWFEPPEPCESRTGAAVVSDGAGWRYLLCPSPAIQSAF
jgi:hypothetical protein